MKQWTSVWTRVVLGVGFLMVTTFGLWHLETSPVMWYDEGFVTLAAKTLAEQGVYGIPTAPGMITTDLYWSSTGYPVGLPLAAAFKLLGTSILTARLVMFAYLMGTAAMVFLVARTVSSTRVATWSVWLVATYAPFYGNGKSMLGETPGMFWFLCATWCWLRATDAPERLRWRWMLGAGVAFGLCAITKPYYLLVLPVLFIAKLIHVIRTRTFPWREELALGLPIVGLVAAWFVNTIPKPISLMHAATLARFLVNPYGGLPRPDGQVITNLLRFVTESTPVHLALLLLVVAVTWFLFRTRERVWHPALLTIGVFVTLTLLWYIRTPGWYRYLYPIHLVALILMPVALWRLRLPRIRPWMNVTVLVALIAIQFTMTVRHIDLYRSDVFQQIPGVVRDLVGEGQTIFLAQVPEVAVVLPSNKVEQTVALPAGATIGRDRFAEGDLPPFVLTAPPDGVGVAPIEPILQQQYTLRWSGGHYRLFELK